MGDHEGEADPVDAAAGVAARYARDVSVNVIGNLLTAAVLYLAGAAANVLPRNGVLIATSITLLVAFALATPLAIFVSDRYGMPHRPAYWGWVAIAVFAMATGLWFLAVFLAGLFHVDRASVVLGTEIGLVTVGVVSITFYLYREHGRG